MNPLLNDLAQILVPADSIQQRVRELGDEISQAYNGEELTVIAIINGAVPFAADLIRQIQLPVRLDCMRVSSYRDETSPTGDPEIIDTLRLNLKGRHVLLIDDILDTGHTLARVRRLLLGLHPASLRVCMLLEKKGRREVHARADWVGFQIPDAFVVGYGLDFAERYRNLPCIGILRPDCQNPPTWIS